MDTIRLSFTREALEELLDQLNRAGLRSDDGRWVYSFTVDEWQPGEGTLVSRRDEVVT